MKQYILLGLWLVMFFISVLIGLFLGNLSHEIKPQTLGKPKQSKPIKLIDPKEQLDKMLDAPHIDPRSIDFSPLDSSEFKFDKSS